MPDPTPKKVHTVGGWPALLIILICLLGLIDVVQRMVSIVT